MKKNLLKILFFIVLIIGIFFVLQKFNLFKSIFYFKSNHESLDKEINILIVPGHEPDNGGAKFKDTYERNLVLEIGQDLQGFLEKNDKYHVYITRDNEGWNSIFSDYFKSHWDDILDWTQKARENGSRITSLGISDKSKVEHNTAPTNVATRLYGITKWANENNINLMVHLHLNDYPSHKKDVVGKYSGMVIYVPSKEYDNSVVTNNIAHTVFKRLSLYNPIDNLPVESGGIIDDSELIAVGANNTSDVPSMLIEYNYIYEPQFLDKDIQSLVLKDLAYQTYLGLEDFFTNNNAVTVTSSYDPSILYDWKNPIKGINSNPKDIYALQTSLIMSGDFPPKDKSKNDCPHSGRLDECTKSAIIEFQKNNNTPNETIFGEKTFELLNTIYNENKPTI